MAVLLPIFFLSGVAALLYQMVWQRMLTLFGGADVYSVTIIVSAFMFGIGLGSLAGGHYADRLDNRRCLRAFAAAEVAVALFAAASPFILFDVLYVRFGGLGLSRLATAGVLFGVLLWPTFFMGASLPLLARAATRSAAVSPDRVGALYGWNTLGAAFGSLFAVWVLVRAFGFPGTIGLGVVLNLVCAAAALFLGRGRAVAVDPSIAGEPSGESPAERPFAFGTWMALYALSGFVALSLEILWFRLLGIILKSNSFTFATLLAIYLLGVGGGALLARAGRAGQEGPRPGFSGCRPASRPTPGSRSPFCFSVSTGWPCSRPSGATWPRAIRSTWPPRSARYSGTCSREVPSLPTRVISRSCSWTSTCSFRYSSLALRPS